MRKFILGLMTALTALQMAFVALPVAAAGTGLGADAALTELGKTGLGGSESAQQAGDRLPKLVGSIVRILIGLLGIVFLVLIVYAGFLWMTAAGNSENVDKAKDIMKQSVIGLIIVFLAYAISGFVISSIIKATTGP